MQREMWAWFLKQGFNPNQPRAPRGTPIGGQWILDLNQVAEKYGWGDTEKLNEHFKNHGKQFGSKSPRDYAQRAKAFYDKAMKQKLPMFQDKYGTIRIYDPKTNIFGAYNSNGTPRTIFKPRSKEKYYNSQIQKHDGKIINPLPEKPIRNIPRGRGGGFRGGGFGGGGNGSRILKNPILNNI